MSDYGRERLIKKTLLRLSRQRVVGILQPGDAWVVENAVSEENADVAAALRTCNIRGWVEVMSKAIPEMKLQKTPNGLQISGDIAGVAPMYRLTEAGWNVLHGSHRWVILTFLIAFATLIAAILSVFISVSK